MADDQASRRRGRPPSENPRDRRVTMRFTAAELADIDRAAKAAQLDRSEWARRQLSVAARQMTLVD